MDKIEGSFDNWEPGLGIVNGGSSFVLVKDSGTYLNSKYLPRTRCGHKRPHELEACHSAYKLEAGLDLMPFLPAKHRSWLSQS